MTTICFIRHGVTEWNKEGRIQGGIDIPLNADGIQMALKVSKRLASEEWHAIYTSPLKRTQMTAAIIASEQPQVTVRIDNRLREIGEGKIEGTTEEERIEKWGKSWRKMDLGFEIEEEVIVRGLSFIEDIKKDYPNEKVLVISHGSFIKKMIQHLCPSGVFDQELGNGSISVVILNEVNHCVAYNCMKHQ